MRDEFLEFSPPAVGAEEAAAASDAVASGWLSTGPLVAELENDLSEYLGRGSAVHAVSSCTGAMQVTLASMGIGAGDVVFTTPMTFSSTVNVIEHCGATPMMIDVERNALTIDPAKLETALTQLESTGSAQSGEVSQVKIGGRPRAALVVHYGGHPCEMESIDAICRDHGLALIEDAAHAIGAKVGGVPIGVKRDACSELEWAACFSFYATKNLTTGEGGLISSTPELIQEARRWSLHGMSRDSYRRYKSDGNWAYDVDRPGLKCNMTDIQAAVGLVQLKKLEGFQRRRKEIVDLYVQGLGDIEAIECPTERRGVTHAWHLFPIRLRLPDGDEATNEELYERREMFVQRLKVRNIGSSVHFIPVHTFSFYREKYGFQPLDFPIAFREFCRTLSLPIHPLMTDSDVQDVVEAVTALASELWNGGFD